MGGAVEAYSEVAKRLGIMPESVQGEGQRPRAGAVGMKARVFIKNGMLDPQGKAIGHALNGLGFQQVCEVRQGKVIDINLAENDEEAARASLKEMCEKLLANTIIE